jgi:hypothetical protein
MNNIRLEKQEVRNWPGPAGLVAMLAQALPYWRLPVSSEEVATGLPCPAQTNAIFPVHVARVQLYLNGLLDYMVLVSDLDLVEMKVVFWSWIQ